MLTIEDCLGMSDFFREANKTKQKFSKYEQLIKGIDLHFLSVKCTSCEFVLTHYDCSEFWDEGDSILNDDEHYYCGIGGFRIDRVGRCSEFKRMSIWTGKK